MFQLVWATPRTALARRFGLSDVAIAKHCRKANIPMPPLGYWARIAAGKNPAKVPTLPLRLPGQEDRVTLGATDRYRAYYPEEDLTKPLVEPVFTDSEEELVAEATGRLGKVRFVSDLSNPHSGLRAVLDSEERLREKGKQPYSSYYKPHFDAPHFQRQLRLINSLFLAFERIGCSGQVYIDDQWVRGIGTTHTLRTTVRIGDVGIGIEFIESKAPSDAKATSRSATTTLRAMSWHEGLPPSHWQDAPDNKLEKQLTEIAHALLGRAERLLRLSVASEYQRRVERREAIVRKQEAERAEAERQRLEEIAQHRQACRQSLIDLSRDYQEARNIRDMVDAFKLHPENTAGNRATFDEWSLKALAIADSIDPLSKNFLSVISGLD